LTEAHGFLSATIPGIWPVLLQKKQVDQANATNGRLLPTDRRGPALSAIVGMTYLALAPMRRESPI
jgi:hypothetical protein